MRVIEAEEESALAEESFDHAVAEALERVTEGRGRFTMFVLPDAVEGAKVVLDEEMSDEEILAEIASLQDLLLERHTKAAAIEREIVQ